MPETIVTESGIYGFFGPYRFLSNFEIGTVLPIDDLGITYPTVEHAYQAAKTRDTAVRLIISKMQQPKDARRFGQSVGMRSDWESIKVQVMRNFVKQKFRCPVLKHKLKLTEDKLLEETNYWNDTFWGVCRGVGRNNLGLILMEIRSEINI